MQQAPKLRRANHVHVTHLQHAWDRALAERLDPHLSVDRERRVFDLIAACDPTAQGRYLSWLSQWRRHSWSIFGMRHICSSEDLSVLGDALARFDIVRTHLPQQMRDVNTYRDATEIMRASAGAPAVGQRALRAAQKATAMNGTEVLCDHGEWKLVRLLSREAAQWWGRGTRWCTSSRSSDHFSAYHFRGPLLVMLTPAGRFQLFLSTGEFKDASDQDASLEQVLRSAPSEIYRSILTLGERTKVPGDDAR